MAAPKPYDQKKRFAHKRGHIVQNHNTEKVGIVVDVQYPHGRPGSEWCWVSILWEDGRVGPIQPTRKYKLIGG